jgi:RNA polymerase sigma-70 factor (ECF subfamily)
MQLFMLFLSCIITGMNLQQEKLLVERAKTSAEAFGELYDMYYETIFNYSLRRSANMEMAKDITSSVFLKALKNINRYKWLNISFSHWLYRIANREIADYYSKRKHETSYEMLAKSNIDLEKDSESGEQVLKRYESFLDLQAYLSKLPLKYQEALTLKYFEDMGDAEIARVLNKPSGTIKSLLHRGIEKLRKLMET